MNSKVEYILDTNCYISFFTKRDLDQFETCLNYLNKLKKEEISIFLPDVILAEVVYVLCFCYKLSRDYVASLIYSLFLDKNVRTENRDLSLLALKYFETNNLDFADCYLLALNEIRESKVITFDKKLNKKLVD